jgi:alpha-beta hydrolase superfamily lysophospholipase
MKNTYFNIATAPALALFDGSSEQSGKCGTILFYHGFGASKERHIDELRLLADAGFLAIGIDSVGHRACAAGQSIS